MRSFLLALARFANEMGMRQASRRAVRSRTGLFGALVLGLSLVSSASGAVGALGWRLVEGASATDIGVGSDGSVWIVGMNNRQYGFDIYQWTGKTWKQIPGEAVRIAVDRFGLAFVVNASGKIFRWVLGGWQPVSRPDKVETVADIGIGGPYDYFWIVGGEKGQYGYPIYQGHLLDWLPRPGQAVKVAVDSGGNAWVVNSSGDIWRWKGSGFTVSGAWERVPGPPATDIGVGADDTVWIIDESSNIHRRDNEADAAWAQMPGTGVAISVDPVGNAWMVDANGDIYRWTGDNLTPEQIAEMVAAHNKVRRSIDVTPKIPDLVWAADLAEYAQEWADKLADADCDLDHRPPDDYGENLFWASASRHTNGENEVRDITPADVVESWASERKYYDYANNSCAQGETCGHYTQVFWENTKDVGCGMAICPSQAQIWVCNYRPPGNIKGQKPYYNQ